MPRLPALVLLVLLALVGCSDDREPVTARDLPPSTTTAPETTDPRYTATATVLESPDHGPQLCLGGVATSYPPQCGGPDLVGWEWDAVEGAESSNGTTWGLYTVVGSWDGEQLTVTEPPAFADDGDEGEGEGDSPLDGSRLATPCDAPPGGWAVIDPATTTQEALDAALAYAQAQPDVAGVWVDQSINPVSDDEGDDATIAAQMNDPTLLILNLRFTGDLDRHENAVRALWGGSLCLSEAQVALSELTSVQAEIGETLDPLWSSVDEVRGVVEVGVAVADDATQADLDARYGAGVVELVGALQPVG